MTDPLNLLIDRLATPVGELLIVADSNEKLRVIDWTDHEDRMLLLLRRHYREGGFALKPARDPGGPAKFSTPHIAILDRRRAIEHGAVAASVQRDGQGPLSFIRVRVVQPESSSSAHATAVALRRAAGVSRAQIG